MKVDIGDMNYLLGAKLLSMCEKDGTNSRQVNYFFHQIGNFSEDLFILDIPESYVTLAALLINI